MLSKNSHVLALELNIFQQVLTVLFNLIKYVFYSSIYEFMNWIEQQEQWLYMISPTVKL